MLHFLRNVVRFWSKMCLFCYQWYNVCVTEIIQGPVNNPIYSHLCKSTNVDVRCVAKLMEE
jgi:hypothetical protein